MFPSHDTLVCSPSQCEFRVCIEDGGGVDGADADRVEVDGQSFVGVERTGTAALDGRKVSSFERFKWFEPLCVRRCAGWRDVSRFVEFDGLSRCMFAALLHGVHLYGSWGHEPWRWGHEPWRTIVVLS